MYKRVIFGAIENPHVAELKDIGAREFSMLAVLAALTLFMGLYPKPFTDVMHASVADLEKRVSVSKLGGH
jgi:NADH-quinone oxidoreductase subunit M